MDMPRDFGPYSQFVLANGKLHVREHEADSRLSQILRSNDYVKYRVYFYRIALTYFDELVSEQHEYVSLISALTTISKLKRDVSTIIQRSVSKKYLDLISKIAQNDINSIDIDALLVSIRLAYELKCDLKTQVEILISAINNVNSLRIELESVDALDVLHNHRDVLEVLYNGILSPKTEDNLDTAIQILERSISAPNPG